jgi:hypothetical protein
MAFADKVIIELNLLATKDWRAEKLFSRFY